MDAAPQGYRAGEPPVSVGDWFMTIFLTAIPIVGFVMLFVWAFGGGANESKANWAKASLLWIVLGFVVVVGFYVMMIMLVSVAGWTS